MVMAAAVLTGVLTGTGMVEAMSAWLVQIIPSSMGPLMAVITGVLSIPMTFFMSNDAFYFGVLPVLSETAAHYGIGAAEMARASITGQPFHMQSPLVPAILLLVSLAKVDLGDHHKKVLWRTAVVSLVMLGIGSADRSHRDRLVCKAACGWPSGPANGSERARLTPAGGRQTGTAVATLDWFGNQSELCRGDPWLRSTVTTLRTSRGSRTSR